MKVYLAGPMTGHPDFNFAVFDAAAAKLRGYGYEVVNPAELDRADGFDPAGRTELEEPEYAARLRHSLAAMLECDAVALLPGWLQSRGAQVEYAVAANYGMHVDTIDHFCYD